MAVYDHGEARAYSRKVLTTHGDPSAAVMHRLDGIEDLPGGRFAVGPQLQLVGKNVQ